MAQELKKRSVSCPDRAAVWLWSETFLRTNRLPGFGFALFCFVFTNAGEKKEKRQLNVVEMQSEQLRNQLPFKKEHKLGITYRHTHAMYM